MRSKLGKCCKQLVGFDLTRRSWNIEIFIRIGDRIAHGNRLRGGHKVPSEGLRLAKAALSGLRKDASDAKAWSRYCSETY
jgi:hypothetical protein